MLGALVMLPSCGEVDSEQASLADTRPADVLPANSTALAAPTATLPFDIPIMAGARYISGSPEFSRPTKRRGGEAIATITYKGTALDIVKFYEKALADKGFSPELGTNNDERMARVWGENARGEKFSVYASRGGSNAEAGESTAALVATQPK